MSNVTTEAQIAEANREIARLRNLLKIEADNPDLDGTDGAHPAWWRGDDHGWAKAQAEVARLRTLIGRLGPRAHRDHGLNRDYAICVEPDCVTARAALEADS